MKIAAQIRLLVWPMFLSAAVSAWANDCVNAAGPLRAWAIDRSHLPPGGDEIDNDSLQLIAQQMGNGQFYVRTAAIASEQTGPARVLFVYSSPDDAANNVAAVRRIFYGGAKASMWIRSGGDDQLVSAFFQSRGQDYADDKTAAAAIPNVLAAALYGGRARLLEAGFRSLSKSEMEKLREAQPDQVNLLQTLASEPTVARDAQGALVWQGRFLRADGGVEELTVALPAVREESTRLNRTQIKPEGSFPKILGDDFPAEEWTVEREVEWSPPKHYGMMPTLAALGNTQMKYKLGTALLQENDDGAIAEGIKWLNSAAADGCRDAVNRLVTLSSGAIRPCRDRELVRMNWCGCSIKRLPPNSVR